MRKYATNSPEAVGRIVALALMADGIVNDCETQLLKRQVVISRLGLADEQFDQIFYSFCEDMLTSSYRLSSGLLDLDTEKINDLLDEIRDPALQKITLRIMLDIIHADHRLTAGEAALIAQTLRQWEIDLYEISDSSIPRHHSPARMQTNLVPDGQNNLRSMPSC